MAQPATGSPPPNPPGQLVRDLIELGGAGLDIVELDLTERGVTGGPGSIRVGVHRQGPLPEAGLEAFDILLTAAPDAPRPWVSGPGEALEAALTQLRAQIGRQPVAAAVAAQVLRMTLQLSFDHALALELLAYSMLLASEGFLAWRRSTPVRARADEAPGRVAAAFDGPTLMIRLDRPQRRNAVDARMRDALSEALTFALEHPDAPPVVLCGAGPVFSAGGDLDEFGQASDVGLAHLVRTLRSPARLAHSLGARLTARLHGACVGAGIEMSAAAATVIARPGAFFRLPEVSMGLIPGAGGTASIPRRIGRRRACYMAISGADIDLPTALAWGLVDRENVAGEDGA